MSSPVEQIKSRLNIVDVVGSYIKLQKAGVNFKALCPFHREKTASFFVSPSRETWHCFGCNRGGDIFSFVMEIEGLEFPEALKILANRAGVELKPIDPKFKTERMRLLQLLEDSKRFYEEKLKGNKKVIDYLKERGLSDETIKEFNIGFASPNWRSLYDFLKNKNYSDSEMEKSGMVIKSEKGYYDRFRSRIIFPLFNSSGQIVGFSGRIFGKEDEAGGGKYINTPQTILYDKSKILYGFDKAKEEIRKKNLCIIVEGYMDAIMSHQAGIKNAVAVSGVALTGEHLQTIRRLTNNIAMAFDRDEAGFQASKRGVDLALQDGFEIRIVVIPTGKDPADAIKKDKNIWEEVVNQAKHIIEFYLESLSQSNKDRRILQRQIRDIVLPYVALINNELEKAHWVKEIAKILSIKEEPVWEELKKIKLIKEEKSDQSRNEIQQIQQSRSRLSTLKERIIGFAFWQRETEDLELKTMIDSVLEKYNLDSGKNGDEKERLILSTELSYGGLEDTKKEFKRLTQELEKEDIKFQLESIADRIRQLEISEDEENLNKYLSQFYDLTKRLNELK